MSDVGPRYHLLAPQSGRNTQSPTSNDLDQKPQPRSDDMFRLRKHSEKKNDRSYSDETVTQSPAEKIQNEDNALGQKVSSLEQQQNLTILNLQRLVAEHERQSAVKRKINIILYPWVLAAVAINLFLWIALLYGITEASYYGQNKHRYFVYAWLIFLIPLLITLFFIFTPRPLTIKEGREKWTKTVASPTSKNLINIANAIACFVAAAAYIFLSAVPQYNEVEWTMTVDYLNELPTPAFVFLIDDDSINFASGELGSAWRYNADGSWTDFNMDKIYRFNSSDYNDIKVLVYNSTALASPNITSPTWQYLYYEANVTYNSSVEDDGIPGEPQLWAAAFDSRLSVTEMLDCGIQSWYQVNAFSFTSLAITVMHITDRVGSMTAPPDSPAYCAGVFADKLGKTDPRFAIYEMSASAISPVTGSYANDCNVVSNASAKCPLTINLNYGNQFVLDRKTSHGISMLEIWLNLGAIVGAIQFVAWFLLQAVGG